ncbi:hypothetical protein L3Q82_006748 [Xyrichtys novacula]|uniref:Uncharacterized protein n=1 Tax=Xyrichtys novacula TaxID=13765 RepID=A0AAV1G6N2_XYRNO|nr:hypothetical protein L3Q82_006748 [Xyrichtys novacula]
MRTKLRKIPPPPPRPAVDQPLLTLQRSHGILTVAGSEGALPLQKLCYGQHRPPPHPPPHPPPAAAVFTPRCYQRKGRARSCLHTLKIHTHVLKKSLSNICITFPNSDEPPHFKSLFVPADKFMPIKSNLTLLRFPVSVYINKLQQVKATSQTVFISAIK